MQLGSLEANSSGRQFCKGPDSLEACQVLWRSLSRKVTLIDCWNFKSIDTFNALAKVVFNELYLTIK